eukprot:1195277-Prorocentrum_minimum.AAC.4
MLRLSVLTRLDNGHWRCWKTTPLAGSTLKVFQASAVATTKLILVIAFVTWYSRALYPLQPPQPFHSPHNICPLPLTPILPDWPPQNPSTVPTHLPSPNINPYSA